MCMQVQSAEEFAAKVKGAGGSPELYIYEGAGHAFLNVPDSKLLSDANSLMPLNPRPSDFRDVHMPSAIESVACVG